VYSKHPPVCPLCSKVKIQMLNVNIDVTCAGSNLTFFIHSFPNKESIFTVNECCCNDLAAKSDKV
jgi:hypothetical protein